MFTVSTVNLNGIRAASKKGYLEWLAATDAQVVCLQEVRAQPDQMTTELREPHGWFPLHAPAAAKGRSGVSLLSRVEPQDSRVGFGNPEFDGSGRYAEIDLPGMTVGSLYLPSGEVGTERQDEKERFLESFGKYLDQLRSWAQDRGREVLICGDWNIAHAEIDLKNWKNNQKAAGFLPEERSWMTGVFDRTGYVDVLRRLRPDGPGPYSWWSYRGQAFDNDAGWRIDYQVATPGLAEKANEAIIERADSREQRWSDHAPVTIAYHI